MTTTNEKATRRPSLAECEATDCAPTAGEYCEYAAGNPAKCRIVQDVLKGDHDDAELDELRIAKEALMLQIQRDKTESETLTKARIAREIFKQGGAWAVVSIACALALYAFTLKPAAVERSMFIEVLKEQTTDNRASIKAIESAVSTIADAAERQERTISSIEQAITTQREAIAASEAELLDFKRTVLEKYPYAEKLDKILAALEEMKRANERTRPDATLN